MVELPFLKKKEPTVLPGRGFIPIDRVREMASRGFSEPEMIDILRREGFAAEEIDKALTQALRITVAGETPSTARAPVPTEAPTLPTLQTLEAPKEKEETMPQLPETSLPEDYYQYPTEEYIDYIVQARVSEVIDKINELNAKYQELEKKIDSINEQIKLPQGKVEDQQQIIQKIESFTETVNDVNVRVGSLEKAFKETLPALIESVKTISDLVQKIKKEA